MLMVVSIFSIPPWRLIALPHNTSRVRQAADDTPHVPRVTAPGVVVEAAGAVVDVEGGVLVVEVELELVAGVAVRVDLLVHLGYGVKGDLKYRYSEDIHLMFVYRVEGILEPVLRVPDGVRLRVEARLHVVLDPVDAHPALPVVDAGGGHAQGLLRLLESVLQLLPEQ